MPFLLIFSLFSCKEKNLPEPSKKREKVIEYSYKITFNDTLGYGYELLKGNKVFIKQHTIPAIQGNKGFINKDDAEKVAELALEKIKKEDGFPSITKKELIELRVIID